MIIYTHPKYDHVQEVDPRETVRIRLLERAGWSVRGAKPVSPDIFVVSDEPPLFPDSASNLFDAKLAELLEDAGYRWVSDIRAASDDDLLAISGIGAAKLAHIREVSGG